MTNSLIRGISVPSDMCKTKMSPCEDAVKITAGGKDVLRNNRYPTLMDGTFILSLFHRPTYQKHS